MSAQKETQAFKKKLKKDISDVQFKADLLSGQAQLDSLKVKGKKVKAKPNVVNKNLPEFMRFMESNYKNSLIKLELKKRL